MAKKSALALLVLAILVASSFAAPKGNKNKGVHPPDAKYQGLTYGEWEARWWQAAFDIPIVEGDHPLISGGEFGGEDDVVFLAAPVGTEAFIEVTIKTDTALFLPILNSECSEIEPDPFHGDDEESMRECANEHIDNTSGLSATIDGEKVRKLDDYRVESPLFEFGPLPANNVLSFFGVDAPEGATSPAVDAGVYLLLTPLKAGVHVVHIEGTFDDIGASVDTTFIITVKKPKKDKD